MYDVHLQLNADHGNLAEWMVASCLVTFSSEFDFTRTGYQDLEFGCCTKIGVMTRDIIDKTEI